MSGLLGKIARLFMGGAAKSGGLLSWLLSAVLNFLWNKAATILKQKKVEKETVAKREEKIKEATQKVEEAIDKNLSREERRKRVEDGFNSIDS